MAAPKTIDLKQKTILVIEDSDDLRTDVIEMLTLEGYTTVGAENGLVGVEKAKKILPDLIVCDIMMPHLDGYGVIERLRGDIKTAGIPFIFLTAKVTHIDQRTGMQMGADDFLTKPFLAHELLNSIEVQLKKREEQLAAVKRRIERIADSIALALPHELRTPLNTIIGFSEMLQTEAQHLATDQVASWASHIHIAGYRLLRVVENYLLYARLALLVENGDAIEVKEAMEDAHLMIQSQAMTLADKEERRTDLVMDIVDAPELNILNDHGTKIVEELLLNAFKFTESGQAITVSTMLEDNYYVLEVKDQGRGMSSEQIDEINAFMQFERDHYEQQGLGLGLGIIQQMTKLYDLDVDVQGESDMGLTVTVRFPTK